jgi:transcriptional regulator with XRE-family HTH domain
MRDSDAPAPSSGDRSGELRLLIRDLVRKTRRERGMSQVELGAALGWTRFQVIRIEKGGREVAIEEAAELDRVLGINQLEDLARSLRRAAGNTDNRRDVIVSSLLRGTPALESVTIVVADDLDVFGALYDPARDAMRLEARDITVVFPSLERERQLFGANPLWGHFEYQIEHLTDLQRGETGAAVNIQIYESDRVVCSAVTASTRTGTQSAFWPPVPAVGGVRGAELPVTLTDSNEIGERLRSHVNHLLEGVAPIRTNEALCRVDDVSFEPRFTRYFAVGADEEDEVASDEGFAVSLVLATALCPRKHYGVGKRMILYRRPSSRHDHGLLSLFSNNVDDVDIRGARSIEDDAELERVRSTRGALAAIYDINDYLAAKGGVIPDVAFQLAASRELKMFGLDVASSRLRLVTLPPELCLIRKSGPDGQTRAAVAPRLLLLELDSSGNQPELDALAAAGGSDVVGMDDIAEFASNGGLNSFLVTAWESGFLSGLLKEIGVVRR